MLAIFIFKFLSVNGHGSTSRKIEELEKKTEKELSGLASVIAEQKAKIEELTDYITALDEKIQEKENPEFTRIFTEIKAELTEQRKDINRLMLLVEKQQSENNQ